MKLAFRDGEGGKGKKFAAGFVKRCADDFFVESDIKIHVLKEVCSRKSLFLFNRSASCANITTDSVCVSQL
jgi:hypothetical protein